MSLNLFGSPRRETPVEALQRLKRSAEHLRAKIRLYRSDKMSDWTIRNEESSLTSTERAISALEARLGLVSKPLAG